ncbi:MAG: M23 family metallopeptidase [Bacteroidales bacterium]|nr:M23 family metallopeptidase [Bacteroidales bacterium]
MAKEKKERNSYKIILYDQTNLHEVSSFNVTSVNIIAYVGLSVVLIAGIVTLLFLYTPLGQLLPNSSENKFRDDMDELAIRTDSLEHVIQVRSDYFQSIRNLMEGRLETELVVSDSVIERQKIDFAKNKHDSILQSLIEEEELQTMAMINQNNRDKFKKMTFYMPVKGTVTEKFNLKTGHLGIDIAAKGDEPILSTLSGTVIIATWSIETGHVIQVQHDNNMLSIYKHNSTLLKKVGDKVEAGDPIAIIGNSGELTSGTHLHFELWHNGVAVNPELYIAY